MQDRMKNRIKHLSNKSQPNFISLNCQSGKYQRVLIARAFTYCVKIGLMSCQLCGVRSPMFAEIGWELPRINFDHWPIGIKWAKRWGRVWVKVSQYVCKGELRNLLKELPRTRLLHAQCHGQWDEHDDSCSEYPPFLAQ